MAFLNQGNPMPLIFKRGQTFNFAGQMKNAGTPYPLAGSVLSADLRSVSGFSLVQHLSVQILDAPTGRVRIFASPTDTAQWKVAPHLIDLRLQDPAGNVVLSRTHEIIIVDRVTQ